MPKSSIGTSDTIAILGLFVSLIVYVVISSQYIRIVVLVIGMVLIALLLYKSEFTATWANKWRFIILIVVSVALLWIAWPSLQDEPKSQTVQPPALPQAEAAIRFEKLEFTGGAPKAIEAHRYFLNFHYTNGGTDTAYDNVQLEMTPVGRPDDRETQESLGRLFEQKWDAIVSSPTAVRASIPKLIDVVPGMPLYATVHRTFTDQEVAQLRSGSTIYYFTRFQFSDQTGTWWSDYCGAFQKRGTSNIYFDVFHNCFTFTHYRYPAPKNRVVAIPKQ
jgi:hypothetical protein